MQSSRSPSRLKALSFVSALLWAQPAVGQVATFQVGTETFAVDRYPAKPRAAKRPVVVMVHGLDGLSGASGVGIRKFAEQVADSGFLVVVPHYFGPADGPDSLALPRLLELRAPRDASYRSRISAAVQHALKEKDADAGKLGLVGFSLGGGQVLAYAHAAPAGNVKAVVDYFGYIAEPKVLTEAAKLPPTLVLHNANDGVVPSSVSRALLASLDKTAVKHESVFYLDTNPVQRNHPFRSGGAADVDSRTRSIAWLKTYLR